MVFKAFNVVVETTPTVPGAGLQQDIFDAILTATGAGGYAYGTDYVGTAVDSEGQTHSVAFDVVELKDFYIFVDLSMPPLTNGDGPIIPEDQLQMATIVQQACVNTFNTNYKKIGRDIKEIDYVGAIQALLLSGELSGIDVIDIRLSFVGKLGPYTPDLLEIGIRQKGDLDTGEVAVGINGFVIIP